MSQGYKTEQPPDYALFRLRPSTRLLERTQAGIWLAAIRSSAAQEIFSSLSSELR